MCRLPVAFIVFAMLCSAIAAVPVPDRRRDRAVSYFPTRAGARWVYQDAGREHVYVLAELQTRGDTTLATIKQVSPDGRIDPYEQLSITEAGMFKLEGPPGKFDAPYCYLKLPLKHGDRWDFHISGPGVVELRGTATVSGPEDVTVPAGTFSAIAVSLKSKSNDGTPSNVVRWFAPEVGLIKVGREKCMGDRVLKSFMPGGT